MGAIFTTNVDAEHKTPLIANVMLWAVSMSYTPNKNATSLLFFILVSKLLIKNTQINIIKYNVKIPLKKMNLLKWSDDCKKNGI